MLSDLVDDLHNFVDKDNDLVLKTVCGISKLSNAANREHYLHLFARQGQVHASLCLSERLSNNGSAKFSKASLEKGANAEDGLFQHLSLHLAGVFVICGQCWFLQRTLSEFLNDCDDLFDRDNDMDLCVVGEYDEGDCKHHASEHSGDDLESGCLN